VNSRPATAAMGRKAAMKGAAEDPFQGDVVDQLRSLGRAVEAAQAEPGVLLAFPGVGELRGFHPPPRKLDFPVHSGRGLGRIPVL